MTDKNATLPSNLLKLCADLRTVAEQLDRPDGWGRAALSVRGAIEAVERLERERDTAREALRISELRVREHWPERDHLRSALEQIRAFALQETHGSSAGYKGIADRLAGDLLKVTTIAREALRGAAPAGETDTSRVAQIRKAPYPESARSQGGGRAHSQGEAAGSTPASGLPVEAKTAVGSGPCQHPFRTHWTGGGDKTGVTCATCGAELAEDKTSGGT